MRRRLLLVFLPFFYAPASVANEALWNCAQSKDSKEWVCVGEKKSADKAAATPAPVAEPVKELPLPPTKAVENTQVPVAEPIKTVGSQPAPTEPIGPEPTPVSVEPEKSTQQVNVEPKLIKPAPADAKKMVQTEANRPGWTCGAKAAGESWDCKLVGEDPKGQARVAETAETAEQGVSLLTPTFTRGEEQTFSNLRSQLKYDPWQHCQIPNAAKARFTPEKGFRPTSPLDINSDYAEVFDNEIYTYTGNVEMTRADQRSVSNKASYDTVSETLDLQGSVYYSEDELALHSESASLNLASDRAKLREALFISPATPLRGRAKTIYRENDFLTRYKEVAYTSCRPGNQDWLVHASELKINKSTGQGGAKNAWVEFKGTPVFYSPYLSFPTDNRRLSGFLAPSFGNTQRGGFTLSAPYYLNIAPNYDATLRPRILSKRGVILGGTTRYMNEITNGFASLEFMPHDSIRNKSRYLAAVRNNAQFSPHISSNLDLNYVSDKDYFSEMGNALSVSTYSSFLYSQANLGYATDGVSLRGHVDNYQSIDKAITNSGLPYRRLPQINLNLNHAFSFIPLNTFMDTEYTYFQHNTLINGQRTNIKPFVSLPLQTASAFITPKLSLQHTQYALSNPQIASSSSSLSRTLPIFSTDSGLYLEKDVNFSNRPYLHTLEPRLFYLYIPRTDQNNIPIFDTALYDPSFNSLFLENRFSGTDRIQDANQLTAAITTRLVNSKSGLEKLKFSVGDIIYFQNRTVNLPGYQETALYSLPDNLNPKACDFSADLLCYRPAISGYSPDTDSFSNMVAELNAGLTDHVSLSSGAQWNPHLNQFVRHNAMLHYINKPETNKPGEIFNVGFRYRKNTTIPVPQVRSNAGEAFRDIVEKPYDIFQSDVSVHWPIYNDWSAVGRWTYSLLNNSTQESFFGLEKENCCWTFRFVGRRWINSLNLNQNQNFNQNNNTPIIAATGVSQTGVFFEVELKGLTGIGEKLDSFFEKQIYGYQKSQND